MRSSISTQLATQNVRLNDFSEGVEVVVMSQVEIEVLLIKRKGVTAG